jgi:hypothetical protein
MKLAMFILFLWNLTIAIQEYQEGIKTFWFSIVLAIICFIIVLDEFNKDKLNE